MINDVSFSPHTQIGRHCEAGHKQIVWGGKCSHRVQKREGWGKDFSWPLVYDVILHKCARRYGRFTPYRQYVPRDTHPYGTAPGGNEFSKITPRRSRTSTTSLRWQILEPDWALARAREAL